MRYSRSDDKPEKFAQRVISNGLSLPWLLDENPSYGPNKDYLNDYTLKPNRICKEIIAISGVFISKEEDSSTTPGSVRSTGPDVEHLL